MTAEQAEQSTRRHNSVQDNSMVHESNMHQASEESAQYSPAMLIQSGRGTTSVHASAMQRAQQTHGNRAVQRFLQGNTGLAEAEQDNVLAQRIESQAGAGGKLPANVQAQLEGGLGSDLSDVRVHTGGEADHLARSMNAVAFTSGSDIFFREGAYNPGAEEGLKLLAHETTHTIQQSAGPVEGTPSAGGVSISNPGDEFEQEAEKTAEAVVSGRQGDVAGDSGTKGASAGTSVQRYTEPTPWMNGSPFVEPTPWLGHGGRHSDWNGMPSGPNLGIEPGNPGAGWAQAPHTPGPQIDNPMFPGGGPFFNPTPSLPNFGGGGGGGYDPAFGGGGGPFFNPTPNIPLPFHDMPGGGTGMGTQPSGPGEAPGPWAYYKQNKQGGLEGGFGAFHGEGPIAGVPVSDDILYGHGKMGMWDDGQGGTRYGAGGDVGVANWSINQGGMVSGQAEALTASAEASWGDSGATLGAQATAVGGSMTFGGTPTGKSDKDESVRLGLSEGVGMAGRLHWGDADHDGHREYGVGADFGPFSFDIKSEDPVRTLARTAAGPLADYVLGNGNATDQAGVYAGQAWDGAKELAGEAGKYASNAYDTASNVAGSAYDTASNAVGNAYDTVSEYLPW